ncbi:MAG: hypothetical protein LBR26_05530, partial [Prevotella sp.]|jgi:hypothetical protein|nr:hypothetical protein [Prevotella sp.]
VGVNFPDDVIDGTETGRGLGTTFTLESVELHNSLDGGLVAPDGGIYPASAPSIPTTPAPGINDSPAPSYSAAPASATADGFSPDRYSCTGAIYMAEQSAGPAVDGGGPAKRPCLVIGGRYGSPTADITYYRLDFVSGSYPNQTFLNVLRNHRYRFNITKVTGPGYDTPEEAFDAAPVNLTVSLTATDESLASYVYDGQYALGVSQDSYTFDNTDRTGNTLQVSTTYEKGYTAVSSNTGWLVITGGASTSTANSPGSPTTLTFRVVGGVSSARTDTIIITAGRLKKKVLVNRKNSADAFSVTDPLSEYPYNTTAPQTLTVTSSYDWYVKITADPDGIIKSFTHSGTGSGFFEFTLNESSLCVSSKPATFAFFSPTGEFTELPKSFQMGPAPFPAYTPNPTPSTHNGWADSNVYWDGTKLTFNGAGNRNYQGVLFKWGSLVGMDPITAWGTNVNVYVYNFNNSNKWEQLKVSAAGYASWTTIPYFDTPNSIPADRAQAYLTAIGHNPANRKGDICRFLTDLGHAPEYDKGTRWRMPTSNEFGGNTDYSGWNSEGSSTTLNVSGTGAIAQGRTKIKHNGVDIPVALQPRFPASGLRESDNGAIRTSGGYYWSSSPANANGYDIDIYDNGTYAPDNSTRTFGQSVRCVRE